LPFDAQMGDIENLAVLTGLLKIFPKKAREEEQFEFLLKKSRKEGLASGGHLMGNLKTRLLKDSDRILTSSEQIVEEQARYNG